MEDEFGIMPFGADPLDDLVDEARILQHEQMGVKNPRIVRRGRVGKTLLKDDQLGACCKQSCLKTSHFRIQFIILKVTKGNDLLLLKVDQDLPFGDTRGHGNALEDHLLSRGAFRLVGSRMLGFA